MVKNKLLNNKKARTIALGVLFSCFIVAGVFFAVRSLYAANTSYSWDFNAAGDYTLSDSTLLEVVDGQVRFKVRNYVSDSDTMLLMHFDESSGVPNDSSDVPKTVTNYSLSFDAGKLNNAGVFNGTSSYIEVSPTGGIVPTQANTLEAWVYLDETFNSQSSGNSMSVMDAGDYQLYFSHSTGKLTYELSNQDADNWSKVAGSDLYGSWDLTGKRSVSASASLGGNIYVGLGDQTAGNAEVWMWNGSVWSMVGGGGVNQSWITETYENVDTLASDGTYIYAGLGTTTGDGEVWRWNGSVWNKIGGDGLNGGWTNVVERVLSMVYDGSNLYVGLGVTATTDAQVWRLDGSNWTKVGGNGLNSGWNAGPEGVYALSYDATYIYAGLGVTTTTDAQVWRFNKGTSIWNQIGGGGLNSGWNVGPELVSALYAQGGSLYAGLGNNNSDAELWIWNGASWLKIGGNVGGSWATGFEQIHSITGDGTSVYVGLGLSANDDEVWEYSGGVWSKIGGDNVNSSWTGQQQVRSLLVDGGSLYAGTYSSNLDGRMYEYDGSSWTQIGGNYLNKSWGYYGMEAVTSSTHIASRLYIGTGNTTGDALVWEFNENSWTLIGGQGVNGSWDAYKYEQVPAMVGYKGKLYAGLGTTAGDAEVWEWSGTSWTQIGGNGFTGWTSTLESVLAMATDGNNLYVGTGVTATADSKVLSWDGSDWTQIGGNGLNSSWNTGIEGVYSLLYTDGYLYAGTGTSAGDGELWRWEGSIWEKIGGDGVNSSWNSVYEVVSSISSYRGNIYVGLGTTAGDAEVWAFDGTTWSMVGGDDVNQSWMDGNFEIVSTLITYNGRLYAALGNSTGDGEVWAFDETSWEKIGGDGVNLSWPNNIEYVYTMSIYRGSLYAGIGNTANSDSMVWQYGDNGYLSSSTDNFTPGWYHIAASYDGTTMRLYVNGELVGSRSDALFLDNSSYPLYIGTGHGSGIYGARYFKGKIDEVRISDVYRPSLITEPYATTAQTVHPNESVLKTQIKEWFEVSSTENLDGGTITYRLSADEGSTWKYWNGSEWANSSATNQSNTLLDLSTNISSFPVTSDGILWQAVLVGNGDQRVSLEEFSITGEVDDTSPLNPSSLTAESTMGGTSLTTDNWYSFSAPYFQWSGANDDGGAGVAGYYVYFGNDSDADPYTAGNLQTETSFSPVSMNSGSTYYLRIKTVDNAQNISTDIWAPFSYKYDGSNPVNPGVVSVSPSSYTNINNFTFIWPSVGPAIASDSASGLAGYQYKTGAESGPYSDWSSITTDTTVTLPDAAYNEGVNTFYLRTVDNAGNVNPSSVQVNYYYSGSAPTEPQNLTVNPSINTVNSFAFGWAAPITYTGQASEITYCYSINTLPSEYTCNFTSAGATSLAADAFATQPGTNTFYLVAKDGTGNINYGAYTSITFTANTSAPGIPQNFDIADVSVKSTSSWKLALSWEAPEGDNTVAKYEVARSLDGLSYAQSSSTTGIAAVETNLNQELYHYKVRACDNTNNCGAYTEPLTMLPDGKFTDPAILTVEPVAYDISTRKAVIRWSTDRISDSKVAFGTAPGTYNTEEPSNPNQVVEHTVNLTNLLPGTTYFYKAKWTDEDGNTGESTEKSFTTSPSPIVIDPTIKSVQLNSAVVQFTVKGASNVKLYYGESASFGGLKEVATSTSETTYAAVIDSLKDGTKYFYRISPVDSEGYEYEGNTLSFTTLPRPLISGVRIQQVKNAANPAILVTWNTNTETSSIVSYYPEDNSVLKYDEVDITLVKGEHKMIVKGLLPETKYFLYVSGVDRFGNEAVSDLQTVTTATDTRVPLIKDLKVETSIIKSNDPNGAQKSQIIVSWNTDEPATSQVEIGEGTGSSYSQKTLKSDTLSLNHVVVIPDLAPSSVYHLRALSVDKAGNEGKSLDAVAITPKATANALDLVVNNLREIFNFFGGF